MKPKFSKALKIKYNGKPVVETRYKRKRGFTRRQIQKEANKVNKKLRRAGLQGRIMISSKFDYGWRSGRMSQIGLGYTPDVYDKSDQYNIAGHQINIDDQISAFSIFVIPERLAGGDDNKQNDCLFKCLVQAFNGYQYLPDSVNTAWKLKRYLGLKRNDKIPVSVIPRLETKIKVKIDVCGDTVYQSDKEYVRTIQLKLLNEHYTLRPNKTRTLLKSISNKERKPIIYRTNGKKGKIEAYDGTKYYKDYPFNKIQEARAKPLTSEVIYIKTIEKDLEQEYNNFIQDADYLKDKTNGLINLYKCGDDKHVSKYLFHCMSKVVKEPEPISQEEAEWIDNAFMGGLVWADDNTELENATCYDINSMYPALMASNKLTFPTGPGEFKKLPALESFISYGIYKATVSKSDNEYKNKQFRFNPRGYYTHFDLTEAQRLGLDIELAKGVNALLYKKRINGHILFKPFVDYLYQLKLEGIPRAKSFLNRLWGSLCEKQTKKYTTLNGEVNLSDCYIDEILPYGKGHYVKTTPKDEIFTTPYARIAPFLTSYARSNISLAMSPIIEKVKRVHTDGFIVDGKARIFTSNELGEFKIEKKGKCIIHNSCNVEWVN